MLDLEKNSRFGEQFCFDTTNFGDRYLPAQIKPTSIIEILEDINSLVSYNVFLMKKRLKTFMKKHTERSIKV